MANDSKILEKDWNEIRKVLKKSKGNAERDAMESAEERSLRNYFGEEKFKKLRDFASRGDDIRKELGNVILIPGIMGSSLISFKEPDDEDTVWLGLRSLAFGGLSRLELNPDGKTNKNGEMIKAPGVFGGVFRGFMFDYYSLALEALQAEPFAYDWRLDVRIAGLQLAEFIQQRFAGQKVSLVAHSMGGLVVRSFIRQNPDLWKNIQGNLIMLGTPNHGSFDAVQALIGKNRTIQKLETFDIFHNLDKLMEIFHSFPGLYQLLPEKSFDPRIYQKETWNGFPSVKFDSHLLDVEKFHQELAVPETIDATRMYYIAGTGFETLVGLKGINNGEFEFETTLEGDGTVSHKLGELVGITTFYDDENEHSDLLNGDKAIEAVISLIKDKPSEVKLETDKSKLKGARGDISRSREVSPEEEELIDAVIGALRAGENIDPEQMAEFERKIQRAIWGGHEYEKIEDDEFKIEPKKIKVELNENDISSCGEEIIAVGKYSDLPPRGACSAIDKKLNYRISLAHQTGMIGSELGQLFFLPEIISPKTKTVDATKTTDENQTNQTIILAGAGSYGKFKREDLRYLVMNVAFAVLSLQKNRFGIVVIGTGLNDFSIDRAVRSILSGIADAVDQYPNEKSKIMEVVIFENDPKRFENLTNIVKALAEDQKKQPIENVKLIFDKEKNIHPLSDAARAALEKEKATKSAHDLPFWVLTDKQKNVTRITVERDYQKQEFSLSALTSTAAIPTRQISIQNCIIDSLIEKIRRSGNAERQKQYGRLLHSMLIPEDFQGLIDTNKPLVLLLDSSSASIPWEMLSYGGSRGFSTFGVELQLSRQFSMSAATVASVSPPVNEEFRVLIIADPAGGALHLDGAEREGRELKAFFEELNQSREEIKIKVDSCIGANECDIVDVLTKIFTEEYDLIHFSGHGHYDKDDETNSGWVFGSRKIKVREGNQEKEIEKLLVISPREIFRLRKVPRLVFANACFTSQVTDGNISIDRKVSTRETTRKLSGIAEAFFARGIENYIGAGWQVNDSLAVNFAKTFYKNALSISAEQEIDTLSIALKKAREGIKKKLDNTTWGAYQHYGDANTKFIHIKPEKKTKEKTEKSKRKTVNS